MTLTDTPPVRRISHGGQAAISALWLAFFAQWLTIPPIVLPDQVAGILGGDRTIQDAATGLIVGTGALVSLVVTPMAGALSDRARGPLGRRRRFITVGVLGTCAGLALFGVAGGLGSLALFGLSYLNLQVWWNWAAGPYAGLIPDVVPQRQQAMASGWMNALSTIGVIAGNLLVLALYTAGHPGPTYTPGRPGLVIAVFIALSLLCLAATLAVREPAATTPIPPFRLGAFLRSFWLAPRAHRDFYLVLVTRLLSNMGVWSILTFLLFYMQSVLGLSQEEAGQLLPGLLAAGAALSIPASLLGVRFSHRFGPVAVVRFTSWVMAAATACYVLIALHPSVALVVPVVIVFSVANGAYGAADWHLALSVLPRGHDAGKDMGIWHVCMVLPQFAGPVSTGLLISAVRAAASARLAYALAFGIGAAWFVLAAALVGRVALPPPHPARAP